jgi:P4 family phage/plasmid primase-like protien
MSFNNYLKQFITSGSKQTHLSFAKGKYYVPDEKASEFSDRYFKAMMSHETLYLIEKITDENFAFFMDIDNPKGCENVSDEDVKEIIACTKQACKQMFEENDGKLGEVIVFKRATKFHLNFPNLVVNHSVAHEVVKHSLHSLPQKLRDCIDTSVYRTGLRMLGSQKKEQHTKADTNAETNVIDVYYKVYDIDSGDYVTDISKGLFEKTLIRRGSDVPMAVLKCSDFIVEKPKVQSPTKTRITKEIEMLLAEAKEIHECLRDFDTGITRISAAKNKMGMYCYYVSIKERLCPFKEREHARPSGPLYIEIAPNGISVKCYDQDCARKRVPATPLQLPPDFDTKYPSLSKIMSSQLSKTDLQISDEMKHCLEESLSGSHYQIAKAAFTIFKERFRVDDVRNTTWFEYDGSRWKRSHFVNILVSEELPKYYKSMKVHDTSESNDNGNDGDKFNSNLRNQMVDNIVSKLENVNFKNNIITQLTFLFKNYDPEFYNNLDENPQLVGFNNGVYDFTCNTFRQSAPSDYITFSTGYDYIEYDKENSNVKEIYSFLEKIITKKEVREYLLKVLGKALVGVPDEKFYIWSGLSGANGKSTLVNFLEHALGDYITSVDVSLLTNKRASSSNASPDIVRLRGKRLFTFQEPEHDDKLRTGILKQFTGGDTIIARELFKAPVTFKLQGTMIMCCNDLPTVASIDGGTWRRIRVIEFNSRFCKDPTKSNEFLIDPNIKEKVKHWRPYFMSMLIHWYQKYLAEGMLEPNDVKKATSKYKADNDKFNEYFDENIDESLKNFESNKVIFNHFTSWWSNNYSTSRLPDIKELRRALKIKFGTEKEQVINGLVNYGYNVKIKGWDDATSN